MLYTTGSRPTMEETVSDSEQDSGKCDGTTRRSGGKAIWCQYPEIPHHAAAGSTGDG